ncbi:MAG: division/cell wall cluster transcriptional repressor MraZ [bacterium]
MLVGTSEPILDSKGRFTLAACFRKGLSKKYPDDELVLIARNNSLYIYPESVCDDMLDQRLEKNKDPLGKEFDLEENDLFSNMGRAETDSQDRILVPPLLRDQSGLQLRSKLRIIGYRTHLRVWDLDYLENLKKSK